MIDAVQNGLIAHGYVTTRVLAAPQNLSHGELLLTVLPGRVQRIVPEDAQAHRITLRNALPLHDGELLNLRDIEQGLENLKRPPTADADIQIEPGSEPGQSELVVSWRQRLPLRVDATVDDSGSRYTGKLQGSLTLSCDACLALSDVFYVTLSHDLGSLHDEDGAARGTHGLAGYFAIPWGYQLLTLTAGANSYRQSVAGATQAYVYSGNSEQFEAALSRVVYRSARYKLTLAARAFRRHSDNFIGDTEVLVQRRTVGGWGLSANHHASWGDAGLDTTLAYRRGTGAFGAQPAPEEAFGEGTSRFGVMTAEIAASLPWRLGEQALVYGASWRWQGNRTPLTPQDRFAIGGRFTVRGFDGEQQLVAEHGWLLRQELAWQIPGRTWAGEAGLRQLYLAVDHGHVGGPSATQLLGTSLTGAALGLRWQRSNAVGGFSAELFAGGPLARPQGFASPDFVTGFSLAYSFN